MDPTAIADHQRDYYAKMMPALLAHKTPERVAAAIEWTGEYCRSVLPSLVTDRRPVSREEDDDSEQ